MPFNLNNPMSIIIEFNVNMHDQFYMELVLHKTNGFNDQKISIDQFTSYARHAYHHQLTNTIIIGTLTSTNHCKFWKQ